MDYAIKLLETEREIIIAALKNGKKERLNDLQQLDKALGWLRLLEEKQLDKANRYHLEPLPFIEGYGGFTNYRIAIDNETDDMKFTKRVSYENMRYSFCMCRGRKSCLLD